MLKRLGFAVFAAAVVVLGLSAGTALAKQNQIKFSFMNTGVQRHANGKIQVMVNRSQGTFTIKVHRATPGLYRVAVNGAVVDSMTVRPGGEGKIKRRLPSSVIRHGQGSVPTASFDPRGRELSLLLHGTTILTAEVPETPDDSDDRVVISTELANLGVVTGMAFAEFKTCEGRMKFEVEVIGAPVGTYDLLVAGVKVGEMTTGPDGQRAKIEFDSSHTNGNDNEPDGNNNQVGDDEQDGDNENADDDQGEMDGLLTFDPRGQLIVIQQNGVDLFSGTLPLGPPANADTEIEFNLTNLGVVPGDAEADFETRQGRTQFDVELDHVAPGSYDLLVGGVMVGTIVVEPGKDNAEIEFDSSPGAGDDDDGGEGGHGDGGHHQGDEDDPALLLTFDPRGMEIVIQQNGVALFSGTLPLV